MHLSIGLFCGDQIVIVCELFFCHCCLNLATLGVCSSVWIVSDFVGFLRWILQLMGSLMLLVKAPSGLRPDCQCVMVTGTMPTQAESLYLICHWCCKIA